MLPSPFVTMPTLVRVASCVPVTAAIGRAGSASCSATRRLCTAGGRDSPPASLRPTGPTAPVIDVKHLSLFPSHRVQTVSFLRHAEGIHNVAAMTTDIEPPVDVLRKEHSGDRFIDAPLSDHGIRQCHALQQELGGWRSFRPDVVIVSPFTRTLQTATLALGDADHPDAPPFIAHELCRERVDEFMCNARSPVSAVRPHFPGVVFDLVESDDDALFGRVVEDNRACAARGVAFLEYLSTREEQHIAVVSHSAFLACTFRQFGWGTFHEDDRTELHRWPDTAEMRTLHLCVHDHTVKLEA